MARFWLPRRLDKNGNLTTWQGKLTDVLDNIKTIGMYGLSYAFYKWPSITSVSFPALTTFNSNGLYYAFNECTGITELHFRADVKSAVEAAKGYSDKFSASNATIYFDL